MSFGPPPSIYTHSALEADRSRARRRRRVLGAVAAVVFAVVCLGVGVFWYHSAGHTKGRTDTTLAKQAPDAIRETVEKTPVSPEGRVVVQHNEPNLTGKQQRLAPGTWATGKILARAVANHIEGYRIEPDPDWDAKAWTLTLDGHVCATSRDVTADGRTAIVVQPARAKSSGKSGVCDEVIMVDLDTGKKLWQQTMPSAGSAFVTNTDIALTQGVVAIAWREGSAAYAMDGGKRLWNTTVATSRCPDTGFAGGRALLALVTCGEGDNTTYRVAKLDPRTGRTVWQYPVSKGVNSVWLPSADPPVIAIQAGDYTVTDLISLDSKTGEQLTRIPMTKYKPDCSIDVYFGVVAKCYGMVVGRDRVFVMSKDNDDITKPENQITAFDLKKGTAVAKFQGRPFQPVLPLRTNGDDLIIYRSTLDDVQPAAVVDWNPRTDQETPYLLFHLPKDDDQLGNPDESDILYEQGHVFFAHRDLQRDDVHPKNPVLSVIGVGSAGLKH
ncbi:outer membrane protein assembly factor BamB family protein [Streptomyces sp. NPDC001118]